MTQNKLNTIRTSLFVLSIFFTFLLPLNSALAQSQEPAEWVEEGDRLLFSSDFVGAEEAYNAAIAADAQYAAAYAHRCYLYTYQQRLEEALADCQQAIELAPQDAEGYIYLTRAYDWSGEYEKAVEAGEQAIQLAPDSGLAHSFLGEAYLDLEQVEEGEREVRLGVELAPETAEVHRNLAYLYGLLGQVENQLVEMETAISLAPDFAKYHEEIAWAYYRVRQYDLTFDYFDRALAIWHQVYYKKGQGETFNHIGRFYEEQGRLDEALETFQQALAIRREIDDRKGQGDTLNNIGRVHHHQGRYQEALESYQKTLVIWRELNRHQDEAAILNSIGTAYHNQARFDKALESYQQALTIQEKINDQQGQSLTLYYIGIVHYNQGRNQEALESSNLSLTMAREVGDRNTEGKVLGRIGKIYLQQGRIETALENLKQALEIAREVRDPFDEGDALDAIGLLYHRQENHIEAAKYVRQALAIWREIGNRPAEASALMAIGTIYSGQGRYKEALENLNQALIIYRESGNRGLESTTLNNIGGIYFGQGRYGEALENFQRALIVAREVDSLTGQLSRLNNISEVYREQGRYEKALETLEEAEAIAKEVGGYHLEKILNAKAGLIMLQGNREALIDYIRQSKNIETADSILIGNIGMVYFFLGRYEEALESYQQALDMASQADDQATWGELLDRIGKLHYQQGHYKEALEYYQQALDIHRQVGNRDAEGVTLYNIGQLYQEQNQVDNALDHYEKAMAIFEELRPIAGSELGRAGFIAQHADLYDNAVKLYHQQGQNEEAFRTSERGRARSFLDSLSTDYVQLSDNDAQELLDQEREAYATLQAIQDTLARAKALNPPDEELVADLEAQLAEAEEAHTAALDAIEARGGQLADLVPGRTQQVSLSEIQANLPEKTTLVSYYIVDEDETLAFILTADELKVVPLGVGLEGLTEYITAFHQIFTNPFFEEEVQETTQTLQQLYEWLIMPLKPHLNTPGVTIIPHRILHYLPFAALTDGETYFSDDYVLSTLPSASVLPAIQENRKPDTLIESVLALGNPTYDKQLPALEGLILSDLPFAKQEVESLAALFGSQVEAHFGTDATESTLRQASQANILHIAAHGIYNPKQPLDSKLILASDVTNDGLLEVGEVYGLDLKDSTLLVVLSACETGLRSLNRQDGQSIVTDGDEIVALNRAFLFAGTPTVLSTLWSVDDASTGLLMERFYTHLQAGYGKAEALRQAQISVREEFPHPYYWAAFVLSGDGGEITNEGPSEEVPNETTPVATMAAIPSPEPTESTEEETPSGPGGNPSCLTGILLLGVVTLAGTRLRARRD